MSYMQEVDNWLNEILKHLPIDYLDEAKQAIKDKIYESYKNGLAAPKQRGQDRRWKPSKREA